MRTDFKPTISSLTHIAAMVSLGSMMACGSGNSDSSGGSACTWPTCIAPLQSACPWSSSPTAQTTQSGQSTTIAYCFPNGVKMQTVADYSTMSTTGSFTATSTVKRSSGEICYSFVETTTGTGGTIDYLDGAGNAVAHGTVVFDGNGHTTATVTCGQGNPVAMGPGCFSPSPVTEGNCSF